jgi:hypothetical protein
LLVDSSALDPSLYLGFREEYTYAAGGCREGEATIEVLGLNREALVEVRRERLTRLRELALLRDLLHEKVAITPTPTLADRLRSVEDTLQACREAAGEYAAMARAFLGQLAPAGGKG